MIKSIKHIIIILALLVAQIAIVPTLPGVARNVNVILVVLIFLCVVYRFSLGAIYGLIIGLFLDLYSALPFGAMLVGLALTLYVVYKIFSHLLTNKSFYTFIGLNVVAALILNFIIYIYQIIVYFNHTKDLTLIKQLTWFSLNNLWWQLLFNVVLAMILFFVFHVFSHRFKAVFIDTTKG